jgi:hypothetical protein
MTASSFALTLLLIATLAASSADHPAFWLLLGPTPLAAGIGLLVFLRSRVNRFSREDFREVTESNQSEELGART